MSSVNKIFCFNPADYRAQFERDGYVHIKPDESRGVWIPTVQLWFRAEGDAVNCYTADGRKLLDHIGVVQERNAVFQQAKEERQRADDLERQLLALREQLAERPPAP